MLTGALPYAFAFVLSALLFWLAETSKGLLSCILAIIALLIPCVLAGCRDYTVGTDVLTYGLNVFETALGRPFWSYLQIHESSHPFGFLLFSWAVSNIGRQFWFYLLALQFLTNGLVYLGLRKLTKGNIWAGMLAYYLLLFPVSLNAMKQMAAIAICFYAFSYCLERRLLRFVVSAAVASLFHQTAVVTLVLYPLVRAWESPSLGKAFFGRFQRQFISVFMVASLALIFMFGRNLIEVVYVLKDSYEYVYNAVGARQNNAGLVLLAWFLIMSALSSKGLIGDAGAQPGEKGGRIALYAFLVLAGCLTIQLNMVAQSLLRFSYYLLIYSSPFISYAIAKDSGGGSRLAGFMTILLFIAYFYVSYVVNAGNEVVPYTSVILGL